MQPMWPMQCCAAHLMYAAQHCIGHIGCIGSFQLGHSNCHCRVLTRICRIAGLGSAKQYITVWIPRPILNLCCHIAQKYRVAVADTNDHISYIFAVTKKVAGVDADFQITLSKLASLCACIGSLQVFHDGCRRDSVSCQLSAAEHYAHLTGLASDYSSLRDIGDLLNRMLHLVCDL